MTAFRRLCRLLAASSAAVALLGAAVAHAQAVPDNPTCPPNPNWSDHRQMQFTVQEVDGRQVLLAEGRIDDALISRLQAAIDRYEGNEIWLSSPGGNRRVAREAAILLRHSGLSTHVPEGATCAGACNFLFMGGFLRTVDPGGHFMVTASTSISDHDHADLARDLDADSAIPALAGQTAQAATEEHAFLSHMGVSRMLLTDITYSRHTSDDRSTGLCLTPEQLARYNVVNQRARWPNEGTPAENPQ